MVWPYDVRDDHLKNKRYSYSLRALLMLMFVIACTLGIRAIRKESDKPDLTITANDVAWAGDYRIWKIDLTDVGPIYGVQIVAFEKQGTTKRPLCIFGGDKLVDTTANPIAMVAMRNVDGNVSGKIRFGGSIRFKADDLLQGKRSAWVGTPVRNGNLYYLMSDSETVGGGKAPFDENSNKIALELLVTPNGC